MVHIEGKRTNGNFDKTNHNIDILSISSNNIRNATRLCDLFEAKLTLSNK